MTGVRKWREWENDEGSREKSLDPFLEIFSQNKKISNKFYIKIPIKLRKIKFNFFKKVLFSKFLVKVYQTYEHSSEYVYVKKCKKIISFNYIVVLK